VVSCVNVLCIVPEAACTILTTKYFLPRDLKCLLKFWHIPWRAKWFTDMFWLTSSRHYHVVSSAKTIRQKWRTSYGPVHVCQSHLLASPHWGCPLGTRQPPGLLQGAKLTQGFAHPGFLGCPPLSLTHWGSFPKGHCPLRLPFLLGFVHKSCSP
jgi:hypothetical protein